MWVECSECAWNVSQIPEAPRSAATAGCAVCGLAREIRTIRHQCQRVPHSRRWSVLSQPSQCVTDVRREITPRSLSNKQRRILADHRGDSARKEAHSNRHASPSKNPTKESSVCLLEGSEANQRAPRVPTSRSLRSRESLSHSCANARGSRGGTVSPAWDSRTMSAESPAPTKVT